MQPKDILLHLRLPFSIFLMPVYWFALSQSPIVSFSKAIWVGILWHFLVYPASNAYNSYFDKDEGSIGGLEKPPAVAPALFWTAWCLDVLAVILAWIFVGKIFAISILIYGLISKAYSHPAVRLKKMAFASWLIVGFFQGAFVFLSTIQGVADLPVAVVSTWRFMFPALLSSTMLWAVYPITQVYQHDEDASRGDITMSIRLGIRGTFLFTGSVFTLGFMGFLVYLPLNDFFAMMLFTLPVTAFFLWWVIKIWQDPILANFKNTMWLNLLASAGLNLFYIYLWL